MQLDVVVAVVVAAVAAVAVVAWSSLVVLALGALAASIVEDIGAAPSEFTAFLPTLTAPDQHGYLESLFAGHC